MLHQQPLILYKMDLNIIPMKFIKVTLDFKETETNKSISKEVIMDGKDIVYQAKVLALLLKSKEDDEMD